MYLQLIVASFQEPVVCFMATKINFDKQISSLERGGGVKGVEQWIWMVTDKIVISYTYVR